MPTYFLDTSVVIAYFMNEDVRSNALIEDILQGHVKGMISAITVVEALVGDQTRDPEVLASRMEVLAAFEVVPVDRSIAERAAVLRRDHQMSLGDSAIAASCI